MVRTPKKAAPGGDERVRRLKGTSVSSNSSVDTESGSEISSRTKLAGVEKGASSVSKKEFKSKLPGPKAGARPSQSAKQLKSLATSSKVVKTQITNMQVEVEEISAKPKSTKEDLKTKAKSIEPEVIDLDAPETPKDQKPSDAPVSQEDSTNQKSTENGTKDEDKNGQHENGDYQLIMESESPQNGKHNDEKTEIVILEKSKDASTDDKLEKEDKESESQTDTESNVVESTTSEISETSEQPSETKEKESSSEAATLETPCLSYDSSITLKSIQIKLSDCLKDNSKATEEENEQTGDALYKDLSFGKTLRTISGRRSLSRLRHVTLREHNLLSPNNSLFVNTSSISQDEDYKILRHRAGLSDSISSNGTPSDRKRKLYPEDSNPSKKAKTESESSFLNSSFELLKSFRRPVQVSTPFNFQTDKLNLGGKEGSSDVGIKADESTNSNKWCVVM